MDVMDKMTANMYVISNLAFLKPDHTVFEAYQEMQKRQVHHLPIVENGKALGVLSDRDLQFITQYGNQNDILCKDVMSSEVFTVSTSEPIQSLAKQMVEKRINSALINNSEGKVVGIFTSTDALKILSNISSDV